MSLDTIKTIGVLVPTLPLIGFLGYFLYGKKLSEKAVGTIASAWVLAGFVLSVMLFSHISSTGSDLEIYLFDWIKAGSFTAPFAFHIDQLSVMMMMLVTGVGGLIHVYSIGYMHKDPGYSRFFAYLNLFIFCMLLLVMANNYVLLFAGWEGVGLCSYLLIGFWYKNHEYNAAANKSFIINRIGDLCFLFGLWMMFKYFGIFTFGEVNSMAGSVDSAAITIMTLLFFAGATGKSAQIPLYTWLPDAMAGPTPVSALIHAATMVTAGIYLIIRSNVLYALAPFTGEIIVVIGIATSILAGLIAIKQNDIKKVLAYSTVSQLGLMFFALGFGAYAAAFFHLLTHAFFKALLFLGAGSVIHALSGEQDIRKMGGLSSKIKSTHLVFLVATLAIIAIPPLAGFFSKDYILASAFGRSPLLWGLGVLSGILTAIYMLRLYFVVFRGKSRVEAEAEANLHESPSVMTAPMFVLAILSVIGGFMNIPSVFGGGQWLENFLSSKVPMAQLDISHSTEWVMMTISTLSVIAIFVYAYMKWFKKGDVPAPGEAERTFSFSNMMSHKFYVDELYDSVVVKPILSLAAFFDRFLDKNLVDRLTDGVGEFSFFSGDKLKKIQNGHVSYYLYAMALGILGVLIIFVLI